MSVPNTPEPQKIPLSQITCAWPGGAPRTHLIPPSPAPRSFAVAIIIEARHAAAFNQLLRAGEWKILSKEDAA
jgi:hypothetical protein